MGVEEEEMSLNGWLELLEIKPLHQIENATKICRALGMANSILAAAL